MPHTDAMEAYLQQVLHQIRWKRARQVIGRELQSHLEDQYCLLYTSTLTSSRTEIRLPMSSIILRLFKVI